ncbi:hypothetical protein BC834DRAFT_84315 [Gloeopeniophorella convolvens]|nr:hypothetical protein BC834DRAFT_84315 [Gloeopeniophorella convolvens]
MPQHRLLPPLSSPAHLSEIAHSTFPAPTRAEQVRTLQSAEPGHGQRAAQQALNRSSRFGTPPPHTIE